MGEIQLINNQILSDQVVLIDVLFHLFGVDQIRRKLLNWRVKFLEQISDPDDLACIGRHVPQNGRVGFLFIEHLLNHVDFESVVLEYGFVFGDQFVSD